MILFGHFPSQQSIERTQNIREKNKNKAHQQAYQNAWLPSINYKMIYYSKYNPKDIINFNL